MQTMAKYMVGSLRLYSLGVRTKNNETILMLIQATDDEHVRVVLSFSAEVTAFFHQQIRGFTSLSFLISLCMVLVCVCLSLSLFAESVYLPRSFQTMPRNLSPGCCYKACTLLIRCRIVFGVCGINDPVKPI